MTTGVAETIDEVPTVAAAGSPGLAAPIAHRTVIEPPHRWEWIDLSELWKYRELLFFLAWRDVKVRYKQTVLGAAWAVLQPAMTMVVFTVFFGKLAGLTTGGTPQPLFYLTGVMPWFFFAACVGAAGNSVLGSERLITKIYFPRLAVPLAAVVATAVDFLVACGLLAVMLAGYAIAGYDVFAGWNLLLAPVIAALVAALAAGLGILLAALNVEYRDFRYVVPFLLQLGMFATPTIYMQPTGNEGGWLQVLLAVNPMTALVGGFRAAVLGGEVPWLGLGIAAAVAAVSMVVGCLYFRTVEDRFADVI